MSQTQLLSLNNPALLRQHSFVAGEWGEADSKEGMFAVYNPATGQQITTVAQGDVVKAIDAAAKAQVGFARTTAIERAAFLSRWHQLVLANLPDLAQILTAEQGKPLSEAEAEIRYAASFIEWFAGEAMRVQGDVLATTVPGQRLLNLKQPVGVVGAITPWNFPAAMVTRKLAPAFAAGCTVVLKPSELTPLTALALAFLAEQAGCGKGVLNVVCHQDAARVGQTLCTHDAVAKITFTGSTVVGKQLMQQASSGLKRLSLELGGNAPAIVFADADLDQAVAAIMAAKFRNAGQTCICVNRILVEASIAEVFNKRLEDAMKTLQVGPGFEPNHHIGPLISPQAVSKVDALVQSAIAEGAVVRFRGQVPAKRCAEISPAGLSSADLPPAELASADLSANFYPPTLLTHIKQSMAISQQEIFGPVAAVQTFVTDAEALALANEVKTGLAGYLFTRDQARIWHFSEQLQVGMLGINASAISQAHIPFGGVKESGFGREGSSYGIAEYLQIKHLCWG